MLDVTDQIDSTGEAFLQSENFDKFYNLKIQLFFPLDFIPKITGYGGFIANRSKYDSKFLDEQFVNTVWDYTAFLQNVSASYKFGNQYMKSKERRGSSASDLLRRAQD